VRRKDMKEKKIRREENKRSMRLARLPCRGKKTDDCRLMQEGQKLV
jgi:hypothetical protein